MKNSYSRKPFKAGPRKPSGFKPKKTFSKDASSDTFSTPRKGGYAKSWKVGARPGRTFSSKFAPKFAPKTARYAGKPRSTYPASKSMPASESKSMSKSARTDWGSVANWYDDHLAGNDTYHAKVIVPNLTRLVHLAKSESLLELGCGQGFVLQNFSDYSDKLTGVDLGDELISIAKKKYPKIDFISESADSPTLLEDETFDVITIVLALQNMKNLNAVMENVSRLLAKGGRAYIVLNHPAFRIPQHSDWYFDMQKNVQSRKVDLYMTDKEISIDMNPGSKENKKVTPSFHRPLQVYSKAFAKNGFAITRLEEWISHKQSQKGPRQEAEDRARREFPLFMCFELKKI